MCCFINFTLIKNKKLFCDQEMFGSAPLLYVEVETFDGKLRENDAQDDKGRQNRHTDVMHEGRLTPLV